jgi:starch phosphorylase
MFNGYAIRLTDLNITDLQAQQMVDDAYTKEPTEWIKKSIHTTAKMGKFSSDRSIMTYADEIWNIEPLKIE